MKTKISFLSYLSLTTLFIFDIIVISKVKCVMLKSLNMLNACRCHEDEKTSIIFDI